MKIFTLLISACQSPVLYHKKNKCIPCLQATIYGLTLGMNHSYIYGFWFYNENKIISLEDHLDAFFLKPQPFHTVRGNVLIVLSFFARERCN